MKFNTPPIKLAVLISGTGRTLKNLIDLIAAGRLNATIERVIASRPDAGGIEYANHAGIKVYVVERKQFGDAAAFSRAVFEKLDEANVDLVALAGWLCLLDLPEKYTGRIMNIHPALLPSFGGKGMYGQRVHEAVLAAGSKISGCTVHFVDGTYDTGPIVLQRTVDVRDDDTPATLAERVFEQEKQAYPEAIRMFQQHRLKIEGNRVTLIPK
jgi:formyltetrahydrofolate-dependent phosphoribosylglycinamide formyltransferase